MKVATITWPVALALVAMGVWVAARDPADGETFDLHSHLVEDMTSPTTTSATATASDHAPHSDNDEDEDGEYVPVMGWYDDYETEDDEDDADGEGEAVVHGRSLQGACSSRTISYGRWSGSSPATPGSNIGWTYTYSTYYLYCNTGYYKSGSGTFSCRAGRYCNSCRYCCRSSWLGCSSYCNQACSCQSITYAVTSLSGSCAQCIPPAANYANNPSARAGYATFTWTCRAGSYGNSVSRTCSSSNGAWSGSAIVCTPCSIPSATNAINPSWSDGTATYTWTCREGYYGTPVSRTCSSTSSSLSWSGSAIACYSCNPPAPPTDATRTGPSGATWTYTCNAGTYGATTTRTCSTSTGSFSGSPPVCSNCGAGYYCTGGNSRQACPGGVYADPGNRRLTSSACSGSCASGYYCPSGSTTPYQNACGHISRYCPPGSATYRIAPEGYYTTPENANAEHLRTGISVCPSNRLCTMGRMMPAVDFGLTCPNGTTIASVLEDVTMTDFGSAFVTTTPGCPLCTVTYVITSIVPWTAGCPVNSSLVTFNTATNKLRVGPWALRVTRCTEGYNITFEARRTSATSLLAKCTVMTTLEDVNEPPKITPGACSARSVVERSAVGTNVGTPLTASDPDRGQQLLWSIDSTTRFPFTIGVCDGQITVTDANLDAAVRSSYTLPLKVSDSGLSPTMSDTCTVTITITDRNDPPSIGTTTLSILENSAVGASAGNIGAVDPDVGATLTYSFTRADSPDAFSIDSTGTVKVKSAVLDYEVKSAFFYKVEVSDGTNRVSGDITINIVDGNDSPKFAGDCTRTMSEAATPGTSATGGACTATDQDGDTLTYSLVPSTPFSVSAQGVITLSTGQSLDYETQSTYTLSLIATDTRGATASASLTMNLVDVNEPPAFVEGAATTRTVDEASAAGTNVGLPVTATDPDAGSVIIYRIQSITPNTQPDIFTVDGLTGQLRVGTGTLDYEAGPRQYSVMLNASDNGRPPLSRIINVTVAVADVDEAPDWSGDSLVRTVTENVALGSNVGSALTAVDPEGSAVTYTIQGAAQFFNVTSTGQLVTVGDINYEDFASHTVAVIASDAGGMTSTAMVRVDVTDVNEAPVFGESEGTRTVAEAAPVGTFVGAPMRAVDPDRGQSLTYSIAANTYFAINAGSGQLTVKTQLPNSDTIANFTVTVTATDNGSPQQSGSLDVVISLSDATVINRPPQISGAVITVSEATASGTVVANLSQSASDPDGHPLVFSIANTDPVPFTITSTTGLLTLIGQLNFEATRNLSVLITVTDVPGTSNDTQMSPLSNTVSFLVVVTDANEQCTFPGATFTLDENVAVGTLVGVPIRAADPDTVALAARQEWVTYAITSGNTGSVFKLVAVVDGNATHLNATQVQVAKAAVNFEAVNSYNLDVTATDRGGLTCVARVDVLINNRNDAPVLTAPATVSIVENSAVGSNVGAPFTATDEDGDSISWEITSGNVNTTFAISAGGQLTLAGPVDFETKSSYSLGIRVWDGVGGEATHTVTVAITDVAEPPRWTGPTTAVVNETVARDTAVFRASAVDPDAGDALTYTLTAGNVRDAFQIDVNTGWVTVFTAAEVDFEVRSSFNLEVTVTDKTGLTIKQVVVVAVLNVNERPSIVTDVVYIPENSGNSTASLAPIIATDPDNGDTLTFTITGGNWHPAFGSPLFDVHPTTGHVILRSAVLDFENATTNGYNLTITATDAGTPQLSVSKSIRVAAADRNEPPRIADAVRRVDENSPLDTGVGAPIPAWDEDAGQTLQFTITAGNEDDYFKIDGCSGQIKVNKAGLDFEANVTYVLTVRVTDDGGDTPGPARLWSAATVTIIINDVNEGCTAADATRTIAENSPVNTPVGASLSSLGTDPDTLATNVTWRTLSFSLASNPRNLFNVSAQGQLYVARNALNYEDPEGNEVTVLVTLRDGPGLTCTSRVTVQITDVNEPPTVADQGVTQREATARPYNPVADGAVVGALTATDPDIGQTSQLRFAILRAWPPRAAAWFAVEATGVNAGRMTVTTDGAANFTLDYEAIPVMVVQVNVSDPGSLFTLANVTVSLRDENENPTIDDQVRWVLENATLGAAVGEALVSTDPERSVLAHSIVSGNADGIFEVDSLSGQVRVRDPSRLDYETRTQHVLTVQVEDTGLPGTGPKLTDTAQITVNVVDCNDPPTLSPAAFTVQENAAGGTSVGVVVGSDVDAGDVLTYAIVSQQLTGAGEEAFTIVEATGELQVSGTPALDFETQPTYWVVVVVRDVAGANATATMTVTLLDVQEAPYFSPPAFDFSVAKNARFGTVIGTGRASDPDAADVGRLQYAWNPFTSNGTDLFGVNATSGAVYVARNGTAFLPLGGVYYLRSVVTDSASLTATALVVVTVVDSNDPPVMPDYTRSVAENVPANTSVGAPVTGSDNDPLQTLTYTIVSGNVDDIFAIHPTTGQITVRTPIIDFETRNRYVLVVQAQDDGVGRLSSTGTVTISVTDVGENPTLPATLSMDVDENVAVGTVVGVVVGSDVDAADVGKLQYSLVTTTTVFAIHNGTGVVTVASAVLDVETTSSYRLTVRVTDTYGLTADSVLTITLNNKNDRPVLADGSLSVAENAAGAVLGTLAMTDQDTAVGQTHVYELTRPDHVCWHHTVTSGNVDTLSYLPIPLPNTPHLQTVLFRARASSATTVRIALRVAGAADQDRYEWTVGDTGGKATVRRCTTFCSSPIGSTDVTAPTLSTTRFTDLYLTVNRATGELTFGTRSGNDANATHTPLLAVTDAGTPLNVTEVGVAGSVAGARISSICFAHPGKTGGALFAVNATTGVISTVPTASADYEAQRRYGLEVKVTDEPAGNDLTPANLFEYGVAAISVVDVNEVATWPLQSCAGGWYVACLSIAENSVATSLVGTTPAAIDPDVFTTQTLSYKLQSDNNLAGAQAIFASAASTPRITVAQSNVLNYEQVSSYVLTITATDSGSPALSTDAQVHVTVTDVNERPTMGAGQVRIVPENSPVGFGVGDPLTATDPDFATTPFGQFNFTIIAGGDVTTFTIDAGTGQLRVANTSALDFERQKTYTLRVRVTDTPGLFDDAWVTVQVTNVNERPVILPTARNISEASTFPAPAGLPIPASDPDENTVLTFSIVGGSGAALFRINRCSGQIELAYGAALDFETTAFYQVVVMVEDDGVPLLNATAVVNITILDANEPPAIAPAWRNVTENAPRSTPVGAPIPASDVDAFGGNTPWYTLTYSIVSGNDRSIFAIHNATGAITVARDSAGAINYEDPDSNAFTLLVRVTDGGGLFAQADVHIVAVDVNEAPFFTDATMARSIDENTPRSRRTAGDNVGARITASDPDLSHASTLVYTIVAGNEAGHFNITPSGATGGQVRVTAAGATALDYEAQAVYNLTVRVTDVGFVRAGDAVVPLSTDGHVVIRLNNRNEVPTCANTGRFVWENATLRTLVGDAIVATDPEDTVLTFAIASGNGDGVFGMDAATGQLSIADPAKLNFEAVSSYTLGLTVRDTGYPEGAANVLTTTCTVVVTVGDVCEPPVIQPASFSLAENSPAGTQVGSMASLASDVDAADVGQLRFRIAAQQVTTLNQAAFAIHATTGVITVAPGLSVDSLNVEAKSRYEVVVEVVDTCGLTANATVVVTLTNVNEPVTWSAPSYRLYARALERQTVGVPLSTYVRDQDVLLPATGEFFTFAFGVPSGNNDTVFALDPTDGQLSVVNNDSATFRYPVGGPGPVYTLRITVTDGGIDGAATSATVVVEVEVTDNNFPPVLAGATFTLDENVGVGTEVGRLFASDRNAGEGQTVTYSLAPTGANINRAFPFAITTVAGAGNDGVGVGVVSVVWDGPVDFEAPRKAAAAGGVGFNVYDALVTATDSHATAMTASAPVRIILRDLPEPPYFAPTRTANTGVFTLTVPENAGQGVALAVSDVGSSNRGSPEGGIMAWDEDIFEAHPNLTYTWKATTPAAVASMFNLHPATGVVTVSAVGAAPAALDFEGTNTFTLTAVATDRTGRSDEATVTVRVTDVNEAPVVNRVLDAAGVEVTPRVNENAPVWTVVGRVVASDPDAGANGALSYSLVDDAEAVFFGIWPNGTVYVRSLGLDFEDKSVFTPTVVVMDGGSPALNATRTLTVEVNDVNDVVVTSFRLAAGEVAAGRGYDINPSGTTGWDVTHRDMHALVQTAGGARIVLVGSNFGRTAGRVAREGAPLTSTVVEAWYGDVGIGARRYRATNCVVTVANTEIECDTVAGHGFSHVWNVTVWSGLPRAVVGMTTPTPRTGYMPPTISSVTVRNSLDDTMRTNGSGILEVVGRDFGTLDATVRLVYGPTGVEYTSPGCTRDAATAHYVMQCQAAPGIGKGLQFVVTVLPTDRQASTKFNATAVRYREPSIAWLSDELLRTEGGEVIAIRGDNFGPAGTVGIVGQYSTDFTRPDAVVYTATSCRVDAAPNDHVRMYCNSVPGIGHGLAFRVTVGGQVSAVSVDTVAYRPPAITGISGLGASLAITEGGQQVIIAGSSFGPVTPVDADGQVVGAVQPAAHYGRWSAAITALPQLRYVAVDCRVTVAHVQMICLTAPGTGKDLYWGVVVGGQPSPVFLNRSTNYHPPVVAYYTGPGSMNADTRGYQVVYVEGRNFGPLGTVVENATYGWNGADFNTSCVVQDAHVRLQCWTVVGAGAGLRWLVTIDTQVSVAPSTAYAPPQVASFSGAGAVDASTDGGQVVTLRGDFFSINRFLDKVTYGPTGLEHAPNCTIPAGQEHVEVRCVTLPGTGRKLKWLVTVGRQTSSLSPTTTSYAPPNITAVSTLNGTTAGGLEIQLTGTDFALRYPLAKVEVKMNTVGTTMPAPSMAAREAYWRDVLAGVPPANPEVARWIAELTTAQERGRWVYGDGLHRINFTLPAGWGASRELFLVVDGVPSNVLTFRYNPPRIMNVAPDRQNVTGNNMRVFVEGSSFCSGANRCGQVYVDDGTGPWKEMTPLEYSHTSIMFHVETAEVERNVIVCVDGVCSEPYPFKAPVPSISNLNGQGEWYGMNTAGGQPFYIRFVAEIGAVPASNIRITIGDRECTNLTKSLDEDNCAAQGIPPDSPIVEQCRTYRLDCISPAGTGLGNSILIMVPGLTSRAQSEFVFDYGMPVITDVTDLADPTVSYLTRATGGGRLLQAGPQLHGIPTTGREVVITGRNLGDPALGPQAVGFALLGDYAVVNLVSQTHTRAVVSISPYVGRDVALVVSVDGQTNVDAVTRGPFAGTSAPPILFRYATPSVTGVAPQSLPTVGGATVTITGANFGPFGGAAPAPALTPQVFVGGRRCVVPPSFTASSNHTSLECVMPEGQGQSLPVIVSIGGQNSTILPAALFTYAAPSVTGVTPSAGPTSGRTVAGVPINMTLHGANLGMAGSAFVLFRQLNLAEGLPDFIVPPTAMLFHNHTMMVFPMPEGAGEQLSVHVVTAGQQSAEVVPFTYDPPTILGFKRADRSEAECLDRTVPMPLRGGRVVNRTISMNCYRTTGGYPLEIVGSSFSTTTLSGSVRVSLGGRRCAADGHTHNRIVCAVPPGLGDRNLVVVTVGGRSSTSNITFAYDPPVIDNFQPNVPDATGVETVTISGYNFGVERTPLHIDIGGIPCGEAQWLNDEELRCTPAADVVGTKNVSVLVANRTEPNFWWPEERKVTLQCKKDFTGLAGEYCVDCERDFMGAVCPGSEMYVDLARSDAGFWRSNYTTPDALCHPYHAGRPACPVFLACEPPWSCLGANVCAEGYEGERCMFCLRGKYYRVNGECVKCPNSPIAIFVMFFLGGLVACGVAWWVNKRNVSLSLISIGIDYFQVLSMFTRVRIRWPSYLKELFHILSAFTFNIDLAAPECLVPDLSLTIKWFAIEALPVFAGAIFLTIYVVKYAYKRCCLARKKSQLHAHLPQLVSTSIVMFRVLYLYLTRTTLDVFNCSPTDPPDPTGATYMNGNLDIKCWEAGSIQVLLFPFALLTLGLYTVGIPAVALWFLRRKRTAVKYDMILRAKGTGDDRLTNPKYYIFRKTWKNLYFHFRPGKWYWEFVILARKALIAFVSLMFRQSPSYTLSMSLLVLFAAYALQVRHVPFMTHTNKKDVLAEHEAKVLIDPLHATIEADMRAIAKKNRVGESKRTTSLFDAATMAKRSRGDAIVLSIMDANSVESVLLCSAILTNVAGVMFDSNRFTGATARFYMHEYNGLAIATVLLIALSITYYVIAFVYDLLVVCAPQQAMVCVTCFSRVAAARAKAAAAGGKGRTGRVAGVTGGGGGGAAGTGGEQESGLSTNPFLVRQLAEGRQESLANEATAIINLPHAPTNEQWVHIRASYAGLVNNVQNLTEQLRAAKKLAGMDADLSASATTAAILAGEGEAKGNPRDGGRLAATHRARTQFTPLRSTTEDGPGSGTLRSPSGGASLRSASRRATAARMSKASLMPMTDDTGEASVQAPNPLLALSSEGGVDGGVGGPSTPSSVNVGLSMGAVVSATNPTEAAPEGSGAATGVGSGLSLYGSNPLVSKRGGGGGRLGLSRARLIGSKAATASKPTAGGGEVTVAVNPMTAAAGAGATASPSLSASGVGDDGVGGLVTNPLNRAVS